MFQVQVGLVEAAKASRVMSSNEIRSWSDLNDLLDRYRSGWIFRGQCQPHDLQSSFAREVARATSLTTSVDLSTAVHIEGQAIFRFAKAAHHYLRVQEVEPLRTVNMDALTFGERLDWLALMQHYGTPTRLLDWTESLFVAAYFAAERAWNQDGEVWACRVKALSDFAAKMLVFKSPDKAKLGGFDNRSDLHADIDASPLIRMLQEHPEWRPPGLKWERWRETASTDDVLNVVCRMKQIHVDELVAENETLLSVVFPMSLRVVTDRIHAQQGWFTVPLDPRINHYDATSLDGMTIEKLVIRADLKREFLQKLRAANVAAHALFPGLDGLGRSVGEQIRLELSSDVSPIG